MSEFEIVHLRSGVKSLRLVENQETFHPGIGPMAEAKILHVDQHRLVEKCVKPGKYVIWDVGLGAAANAIAAIESIGECTADVEIHSFDKTFAPLQFALENKEDLDYILPFEAELKALLETREIQVNRSIRWYLHKGDFREQMLDEGLPSPHSIFYDPYSSVSNQEMWTLDHFKNLRDRLDDNVPCLLTNYTGSSAVRVTWLMAGFYVGSGFGVGKKAETTVASNQMSLLERPLSKDWLSKRPFSQSSAPLRESVHKAETITAIDYATLSEHNQFA